MGQPLGFGIAFMRIEHYMKIYQGKALSLAAGQMLSVFLCSIAWMAYNTHLFHDIPDLTVLTEPFHAVALGYTGIVTSALAVVLESIALAYVPAEETAVIFSTEPLWAAATSAVVLGERLKPTGMLGGFAILSACLLTQLDVSSLAEWIPLAEESTQKVEQ
jgi:drug/metabolite transporter (DMT)-like permease